MPIYPYCCTKCGYRFEKIQSFSDTPATVCPKCGGVLERLLAAPALQFKGSGWYVNDYGGGKSGNAGTSSVAEPESKSAPAAVSSTSAASAPAAAAGTGAAKP